MKEEMLNVQKEEMITSNFKNSNSEVNHKNIFIFGALMIFVVFLLVCIYNSGKVS